MYVRLTAFIFGFTVLLAPATYSQAPAAATPTVEAVPAVKFEYAVATVKPDKSEGVQSYWRGTPDGFTEIKPLIGFIMDAYAIQMPGQVVGLPAWASSEKYAIEAKMDGDTAAALAKLPSRSRVSSSRRCYRRCSRTVLR